jgi:hypothetical protein
MSRIEVLAWFVQTVRTADPSRTPVEALVRPLASQA